MMLFLNCLVENPAFGSQTKDTLTTQPKDFGSTPILSEKFIKAGGRGLLKWLRIVGHWHLIDAPQF